MMSLTAPASFVHVHTKSHLTDALSLVWSKYKQAIGGYLLLNTSVRTEHTDSSLSLVHRILGGQSQMSGACAR